MTEHHPPTDPNLWEGIWAWLGIVGAAGTGLGAMLRGKLRRSHEDNDELIERVAVRVARECADMSRTENDRHRDGITEAIDRLEHAVERLVTKQGEAIDAIRAANDKTRDRVADLVEAVRLRK